VIQAARGGAGKPSAELLETIDKAAAAFAQATREKFQRGGEF
jgi:hypothetical protein